MKKISIIYWSGTGNTEAMANLISQGATSAGNEVTLLNVSDATDAHVKECDVLVLGSPAMGCENIDEYEMEPFMDSVIELVANKKVFLFGSYDWGNGEFIDNWTETLSEASANVIGSVIVNMSPDDDEKINKCIEAGKNL